VSRRGGVFAAAGAARVCRAAADGEERPLGAEVFPGAAAWAARASGVMPVLWKGRPPAVSRRGHVSVWWVVGICCSKAGWPVYRHLLLVVGGEVV